MPVHAFPYGTLRPCRLLLRKLALGAEARGLSGFHALLAILLVLSTGAHAQKQYGYDLWTAESGLPQNGIRGVTQTPDGYLWVATLDGLARFDGVRFTLFDKSNTPGISSNLFSSMVQGKDGDLWLADVSGGLTRFHQGRFHGFTSAEGLPTGSVRGLSGDDRGNVWILSEERILQWDQGGGELKDVTPQNLNVHLGALDWDSAGFWGIADRQLYLFTGGQTSHYHLPAWIDTEAIWNVAREPNNGALWIEGLDGRHTRYASPEAAPELLDAAAADVAHYHDAGHGPWTIEIGPRLARSVQFESSHKTTRLPLTVSFRDHEGNTWIGTEGSGLYRLQEQSIAVYSTVQGLPGSNVYTVFQDRSGIIWIGTWDAGLSRFDGKRFQHAGPAQGLSGHSVSALAEDRRGNLWVALRGTAGMLRGDRLVKPFGIKLPVHSVVQAMLQDRGGTFWLGTSMGVVVYRDGPSRVLTTPDGLATDDARALAESGDGDIWIGGYGGLTRVHDGQFTRWTERDGLPSDNIRALHFDADGTLWIGTYDGGLGRLKDGHITRYRESDGLFSNGVFQILDDGRGSFWMSSNRGIYRVSKQDLTDFAEGRLPRITSVAYGKSDGLLNVECNGGLSPAGMRARDGKLWFPTQDGVAVIDPQQRQTPPKPPSVLIERVMLDGVPKDLGTALTVSPGQRNLEIEYTALSFVRPTQIRFRYKLDGLDTDWQDAGVRRTAYLAHLPPGSYTFRVIARNSEGVWNTDGPTLSIRMLPPFYRTWWFTLLELLALAAVLGAIARLRFLQYRRVQAFSQQLITSQEAERQRIAAELHDSLGQRLVVINNLALFSARAQRKAGREATELATLEEISTEATSAIRETREISYDLRPFQLDRLGLTKAVEGIVRAVASASTIHISFSLDNVDDAFPENLRIHLYRVVQECLNNVMKHAQASEAEVNIVRGDSRILLLIRDNGIGIQSPSTVAGEPSKSGFGLTGLKQRAQTLGGELRIRSSPGQGAEFRFEFSIQERHHV